MWVKKKKSCKKAAGIAALIFLCITAGMTGCGSRGMEEISEENPLPVNEREQDFEEHSENQEELVLSLAENEEIRSMWMEGENLYVFLAPFFGGGSYRICQVKEKALLEENKYTGVMEECVRDHLGKPPASSYVYEARYGRNHVVYLVGKNGKGEVKRCYWLQENFYTDVLFYKKYKGRFIKDIEISRQGKIYLESYGGYIIPYGDFDGRIGFASDYISTLGDHFIYQFAPGWIYKWEFRVNSPMERIKCDTLAKSGGPIFIDEKEGIYVAGTAGLAYLPYEGTIWEILIDGDIKGFDASVFDLKQMWVNGTEVYLLGQETETGAWQILKYHIPGEAAVK